MATVYKHFERYERMHVWTVREGPPSSKGATFQSWIYGARRARELAEAFAQRVNAGNDWDTEHRKLPTS